MAAMANLANNMEANAAMTLQAAQRLGQPTRNGDGNGDDLGGPPMILATFLKVHPPTFRGSTNPTEADNWFQAMECALQAQHAPNNQYMEFAAYQLLEEAHRFEELYRFSRACQGALETYESWKCVQYQRGLKDDIITAVAPMEIRIFSDLVNKARVVEEYTKTVASSKGTHGENTSRECDDYLGPRGQNFKRYDEGKLSRAYSPDMKCQEYGSYHPNRPCQLGKKLCYKCGAPGHLVRDYPHRGTREADRSQQQG
ncbi:uncharacterized protein LOC107615438 [Arachis ipaensis]|uniref:uncharacterized protein LOC107615438 n=1 Tax=Arachis ipaensis TaxID=130454 RepID=UPI0007AF8AFA|nr:uncharacterized protein LOC107615438 [Arachis ipaensis]